MVANLDRTLLDGKQYKFRTLRDDRSKATRGEVKVDVLDNCAVMLVALQCAAGQQVTSMAALASAHDEVRLSQGITPDWRAFGGSVGYALSGPQVHKHAFAADKHTALATMSARSSLPPQWSMLPPRSHNECSDHVTAWRLSEALRVCAVQM